MGYVRLKPQQYEKPPWEFKAASLFSNRFLGINTFGFNTTLNNITFEDIWTPGGNFDFLDSAELMDIVSTDAGDTLLGIGARTLEIFGLDGNYDLIGEVIELNGLTPVSTILSYLRVTRMIIKAIGVSDSNLGTITATAAVAATVQSQVDIDLGQSSACILSVPRGSFAYVTQFQSTIAGGDSGSIDFQTRSFGEAWRVRQRIAVPSDATATVDFMRNKQPIVINPRSDIKMRGLKDGGGGAASVAASFNLYFVDEREINTAQFEN